jgi:hypothetical protein
MLPLVSLHTWSFGLHQGWVSALKYYGSLMWVRCCGSYAIPHKHPTDTPDNVLDEIDVLFLRTRPWLSPEVEINGPQ